MHSANGGSANNIPMPKLSSPAAPGQLTNCGGGVSMPRLASPAMPGMSNSMHGLSGLSGLHLMQSLSGNNNNCAGQTSQSSGVTITPAHSGSSSGNTTNSTSHSLTNVLAHLPSATTLNSGSLNISQIGSPGSIHDLRITSPDENRIHSPIDSESAGVNLATYKSSTSRNYSSPSSRSELFADELNDFMNVRSSRYKDSTTGIKIEPLAECRGD